MPILLQRNGEVRFGECPGGQTGIGEQRQRILITDAQKLQLAEQAGHGALG